MPKGAGRDTRTLRCRRWDAQAKAASTTVPAVDVVVTSKLDRANETGRLIAEAIGVPVTIEEELRERDIGAWTGLTRDDIEAGWPGGSRRAPAGGLGVRCACCRAGMDALRHIARRTLGSECS